MKAILYLGLFASAFLVRVQAQSCAPSPGTTALSCGLKGYWKLDEASGTRLDSSTNYFHLSTWNNVQYTASGKLNGAVSINASTGNHGLYTSAANARAALAFTNDWTVSAWVNASPIHANSADNVFAKPGEVYFWRNANNTLSVYILNGAPNYALVLNHQFSYVLPSGQWRHLVLQRNGSTISLFVDGQLKESVAFSIPIAAGTWDFWVGMQKDGWPWNGSIDEVGYWGRSLNVAEVTALYGNGTPPAYESFGGSVPLAIAQHPLSQTVSVGDDVTFSVSATGPGAVNYQWHFNGSNIAGETHSTLTLSNVTTNESGTYNVTVSSGSDSLVSDNATLTVLGPVNGGALLTGLKGYWKLDEASGIRSDSGSNHFHLSTWNNVQYTASGKLNGAVSINASTGDNGLYTTAANARAVLAFTNDWTVSAWVNASAIHANSSDNVFAKPGEVYFWRNANNTLTVYILNGAPNYALVLNHQFNYVLPSGQWRHLVLQRSGNMINLFVEGQLKESVAFSTPIAAGTWDFWVGMQKDGWPWNGLIDEVGYWGRSLNVAEVTALYGNGTPPSYESFGGTVPLVITEHPSAQTVSVGDDVTFAVNATGAGMLTYQWHFNGSNIAGETNSTLTLTNVTTNKAGTYNVTVSSGSDSVASDNATLTVLEPVSGGTLLTGLKAYWKLDEVSGPRSDSNTNHFHLSSLNNVQYNASGKLNGAASFTASSGNQGLYTTSTNARSLLAFTNDWTVSAWVNASATHYYSADNVFAKPGEVYFWRNANNTLTVYVLNGAPNYTLVLNHRFNYVLPSGQWRHLVLQRTGNIISLFVDGQLKESVAFSIPIAAGTWDFWVGMQKDGWPWNGLIDEVGYWGRSLNVSEVAALYGNGNPPAYESFGEGGTIPLAITQQPSSQTVSVGDNVTFAVSATGPGAIEYQWHFNGSDIAGETNSSLTLSNVTTNKAGTYNVTVSTGSDSLASDNATLVVLEPVSGGALLTGLKAYWKLDEASGTRLDSSTNHFHLSSYNNVPSDTNGKLNGAALFAPLPQDQGLHTSDPSARSALAFTGDWSVSAWVNANAAHVYSAENVFAKPGEVYLWRNENNTLTVYVLNGAPNYALVLNHQFNYVLPSGQWRHLVLQRSGNTISLFVDGHLKESVPFAIPIAAGTWDFWIGMQKDGWSWNGLIDEVGFWNRSLNAAEVAVLYGNGTPPAYESFGDGSNVPLVITLQPSSQTVSVGDDVTFLATATGSGTLDYQWHFNGNDISGATDPTLTLENVTTNNAGTYNVTVSNGSDSIVSDDATLTVLRPPASPEICAGIYCGLFYEADEVRHHSSGFVTLNVKWNGSISGKMRLDGDTLPFSGKFTTNKTSEIVVYRHRFGKPNLSLSLALDCESSQINGTVTDGTWIAALLANRAAYGPVNPATSFAGRYTMLMPGADDPVLGPPGYGYGLILVKSNGVVSLSGKLADAAPTAQAVSISRVGEWPLYIPLYAQKTRTTNSLTHIVNTNAINYKGSILGWLTFTTAESGTDKAPRGVISWIKSSNPTNKYYPTGFTNQTEVLGSFYRTNEVPDVKNGTILFAHGDLGAYRVYCPTNLNSTNFGSIVSYNPKFGLLTGSFSHPGNGTHKKPFGGAFLQEQNCGAGFFVGTNQAGLMLLRNH